jgi:hypothetical protein
MAMLMQSKAGLIGMGSALIGSLLFALIERISFKMEGINTIPELIRSNLSWIVLIFCVGSALSIVPGYLGGRIIARLSEESKWSRPSIVALGAVLGIIAVVLISLPYLFVVLAAHNYWSIINNPAFPIYLIRLIEAAIIAGLMGSLSSFLIAKS